MSFLSDEQSNELKAIFFESAQELMQSLNEEGLSLEQDPSNAETVRSIRRTVHTLKGDSAACGYRELSELAHVLEDVLTPEIAARAGKHLANVVLNAADVFDGMLSAYRNNQLPPNSEPIRAMVDAMLNGEDEDALPFQPEFHWSEAELEEIRKRSGRGQTVYFVGLRIDHNCPMRTAALQLLRNVIAEIGSLAAIHPEGEVSEVPEVIEAAIASHHHKEWVEQKCKIPSVVAEIVVQPFGETPPAADEIAADAPTEAVAPQQPQSAADVVAELVKAIETPQPPPVVTTPVSVASQTAPVVPPPAAAPAAPVPVAQHVAATQTPNAAPSLAGDNILRVEAERVDMVLDLVGELIIGKSMFRDCMTEYTSLHPKDPVRNKFVDALAFQTQVLNKLQRAVMKIRMVPVEQLFRRFPRLVRDVALASNKNVRLELSGEDTDLDKGILDSLAEPLTHLLRNAIDHGLETEEERLKAGKPEQGVVQLNAYHQGNQVVIEVTDDGCGIDRESVTRKALEKGMVTREELEHMSDDDTFNLIFQAGLSTSARVTEISGRGVGMDVVKSVMERLKGSIHIQSDRGRGTTFQLKLPLTLAIIKALLFRVHDRLYAIPLGSVLEIARAHECDVHWVDKHEVIKLRDELLTIIRLRRIAGEEPPRSPRSKLFILVVALGHRKYGLVVDRLAGEQELVIKALDENIVASELVAGASVLGDGRVVLILNISSVIEKLGRTDLMEGRGEAS